MGQPKTVVYIIHSSGRVGIDTPVFISHIQQTAPWASAAATLLRAVADGEVQGVTSVVTLLEVTTHPLRLGRPEIADAYEALLGAIDHLAIVPIDPRVARMGAGLRATYGLRTPDALQIAACIAHGAEVFVTNDRRLRRVSAIEVLLLDDLSELV